MEIDHIVQKADDGPDDADNLIPVCFECHAEIHHYNISHPRGKKFQPSEIRAHRNQWFEICRTHPEMFVQPTPYADAGPLEALIEELGFNVVVARYDQHSDLGCPFHQLQFRRAIDVGALSTLREDLKLLIHEAYGAIGRANNFVCKMTASPDPSGMVNEKARATVVTARDKIKSAHEGLLKFLHRSNPDLTRVARVLFLAYDRIR